MKVVIIKRLIFQKTFTAMALLGLILFQIRVSSPLPVSGVTDSCKLAVLMYHGFTDGGKSSTYVLDAKDFEKDIIHLKENGFDFVDTKDLINFCENGTPLPPKPVMLTFDDGYLNNYVFAFPIMQKYGVKAVISPIASCSDFQSENPDSNTAYAHMTWTQLAEMHASGLADIQNHSYSMHTFNNTRKGSAKVNGETPEAYRRIFYEDMKKAHNAIKNATGTAPVAYAYPFGSISSETKSVLICAGYKISFTCNEGFNTITADKNSLYMLKRFNRTPEKSAADFLQDY